MRTMGVAYVCCVNPLGKAGRLLRQHHKQKTTTVFEIPGF